MLIPRQKKFKYIFNLKNQAKQNFSFSFNTDLMQISFDITHDLSMTDCIDLEKNYIENIQIFSQNFRRHQTDEEPSLEPETKAY